MSVGKAILFLASLIASSSTLAARDKLVSLPRFENGVEVSIPSPDLTEVSYLKAPFVIHSAVPGNGPDIYVVGEIKTPSGIDGPQGYVAYFSKNGDWTALTSYDLFIEYYNQVFDASLIGFSDLGDNNGIKTSMSLVKSKSRAYVIKTCDYKQIGVGIIVSFPENGIGADYTDAAFSIVSKSLCTF